MISHFTAIEIFAASQGERRKKRGETVGEEEAGGGPLQFSNEIVFGNFRH